MLIEIRARHLHGICLALAVLLAPTGANAFDTLAGDRSNWSGTDYSIGRLSPNIPNQDQIAAIQAAFNAADVAGTGSVSDRPSKWRRYYRGLSCRWPAEFGRYAAACQTSSRRGRIVRAEISLNEEHFEWSTNPGVTKVTQGVVTHEVGHAIGLGHSFYRDATMYWTGGDVVLRTLSADDERGTCYLYDPDGAGQLCDLCESTMSGRGAFCLALEANRAFCGAVRGRCPQILRASISMEANRLRSPGSRLLGRGPGPFADGDYCYGSDQCGPGKHCIATLDSARCVRTCIQGGAPCPQGECVGGGGGEPGVCMTPGNRGYGEACESNFDCQSLSCIPLGAGRNVCTIRCDPARDECPEGRCTATAGDDGGICIPPGNVGEGQACGFLQDRCAEGMVCVRGNRGSACRRTCAPFGECPAGQGCSQDEDAGWVCLPQGPIALGAPCDSSSQCGGGRLCAPIGSQGRTICAQSCPVGNEQSCDGRQCIAVGNGRGACPTGDRVFGDPCSGAVECRDGACVWTPDGDRCSTVCNADADCPMGFSCLRFGNNQQACFENDNPGAGGAGGSGGSPGMMPGAGGQGGQSSNDMGRPRRTRFKCTCPSGRGRPQLRAGQNGSDATTPQQENGGAQGAGPNRILVTRDDGGGCTTSPSPTEPTPWLLTIGLLGLVRRRLNGRRCSSSRKNSSLDILEASDA